MTRIYCEVCRELTECELEPSQETIQNRYFELPDSRIYAYTRNRMCLECLNEFRTYEVNEECFDKFLSVIKSQEFKAEKNDSLALDPGCHSPSSEERKATVTPIDPMDPDERITVVSRILETCYQLQEVFPDVDLSEQVHECEAGMAEAKDIKRRQQMLNQQRRGGSVE